MSCKTTSCPCCGGSGKAQKAPPFKQLLSSECGLYALADDGTVWVYVTRPARGWKPIETAVIKGDRNEGRDQD